MMFSVLHLCVRIHTFSGFMFQIDLFVIRVMGLSWYESCSEWLRSTRPRSSLLTRLTLSEQRGESLCLTRFNKIAIQGTLRWQQTRMPLAYREFTAAIISVTCPYANVLARHALSRYDNAFLQNDNAFLSFQITPISMSNNCIFWRYE